MITKEFRDASAEISEILSYLPQEEVEKIPDRLRYFFYDVKNNDYVSKIDPYKPLDDQKLLPKTEMLLTVLYRNYWCSVEERNELDKILIENDKTYEEELREKYNPDNIFKKINNDEKIKTVEETSLSIYENKTWHKKAFLFISNMFKKVLKN